MLRRRSARIIEKRELSVKCLITQPFQPKTREGNRRKKQFSSEISVLSIPTQSEVTAKTPKASSSKSNNSYQYSHIKTSSAPEEPVDLDIEQDSDVLALNDGLKRSILPPSEVPTSVITVDDSFLSKALAHLAKVEPRLKPVIEQNPCQLFSPEGLAQKIEPFVALSESIISQQLSNAASKSVKRRFISLFNPNNNLDTTKTAIADSFFPTPAQVCATSYEVLRTAGLSRRKAEYIKGLAAKFNNGELDTDMLLNASYTDIYNALIKVRGLGRWSVEMFACFGLRKLDIFSTQDLAVQRGMAALLGKDIETLKRKGGKWKYMTQNEMEEMAIKFIPYRSVFMWYTWRVEKTLANDLKSSNVC